ncbi:HlyD family efflux transporter periplasmic adaptor subunit [Limimaricola litoreus]|uniref:HlyD family efflux transporter periplasmic adaptor subunit n=1 Tax=Limimaricola litoreus TaxID=2955316 RepID=A0A9X2JR36_9RHOB|nr:HlyD family efflux transporter periplasmic adaptor subunit [Limimaricola litoreus]MCP1170010.1 HlyD family efflux transporter periplasmic adaptor subunit [Limimaricola litoreus]
MRFTRLFIGLLLVLVSIWVIVGEQMGGASANAMVNARLATLRAPIAGKVTMPDLALGATVRRSEELASVSDSRVDRIRLNDLVLEQRDARIERDRLRDVITETRNMATTISVRAARFERSNIRQAEIRLNHALERLALLEERARESSRARVAALEPPLAIEDPVRRARPDTGLAPNLPRDVPSDLALAVEWAREEVGVRRSALSAARDGVFVANDYSDSPYAGQRLAELRARLDGFEAAYRAQLSQISALDKRIVEERISVNHLTEAPLISMLDGRLWEVLAGHGERVERGQDILRLLDCGNVIVTASVSESVYNRLKPGDAARFRLSGTGEVFHATVERLAGAGAATIYRNLAVAPGPKHLERYDVAVSVPGLSDSEAGYCPVGRTGRVFFEGRPLDRLRGLL